MNKSRSKLVKQSWQKYNATTEWYLFSLNTISSNINWNDNLCTAKNELLLLQFNFYLSYHESYVTENKELSSEIIMNIWHNKQKTLFKKWRMDQIDHSRYLVIPFFVSSQNHWYIGIFILNDKQDNPISKEVNLKITRLIDKPSNVITHNILINCDLHKMDISKSSNFVLLDNIENKAYYESRLLTLPTSEKRLDDKNNNLVISISNLFKNVNNMIPELQLIFNP